MKNTLWILSFLWLIILSCAQTKKPMLIGAYGVVHPSEQYFIQDTIPLTRITNARDFTQGKSATWTFTKHTLTIQLEGDTTSEASFKNDLTKHKIKILKTDFGHVIAYVQGKNLIRKYRIIAPENNQAQQLLLMHFDQLSEQKLYKYVDALMTKVLKYDPEAVESDNNYGVSVSQGHPKISVRDLKNPNPEPLIVVNGYPLPHKEILKELLLVETYEIGYITKEKASSIFGYRAINGVILLKTSEKRFKAVRQTFRNKL